MDSFARRLRTPEERVGMLPNASLPPPQRPPSADADEQLLRSGLIDRDETALARVLDRLFPAMLRLSMYHTRSRAAAEEIVQETWLAAIRGIDRFEGRSSLKTWLFHILRNLAVTRGRRDASMRTFSELRSDPADTRDEPGDGPPLWTRADDPERRLLAAELGRHIERAMASLPPRQREVLVLRDVEGWTSAEVCNALGISQTNQRVLLHRARDRVRRELQVYLVDYDGCPDDDNELLADR